MHAYDVYGWYKVETPTCVNPNIEKTYCFPKDVVHGDWMTMQVYGSDISSTKEVRVI